MVNEEWSEVSARLKAGSVSAFPVGKVRPAADLVVIIGK